MLPTVSWRDDKRFWAVWAQWCEYRHESGWPLTRVGVGRDMRKLEKLDSAQAAIEAIEACIDRGYRGLFVRKPTDTKNAPMGFNVKSKDRDEQARNWAAATRRRAPETVKHLTDEELIARYPG